MGVTVILAFVRKNWQIIALVLAALAVWWYHNHLTSTIEEQKVEIANLTTANTVLKENNEKLEASIEANNAAIQKLAEGAADTKKNFAALGATVKTQTAGLEQRLRGILAEKKPQTCEESIQYLIDAAKEYQK